MFSNTSIQVRVPCDTLSYVESNYGPDWFTPVMHWDWKKSPSNVQENGVWPQELWPDLIRCDNCVYDTDGRMQL